MIIANPYLTNESTPWSDTLICLACIALVAWIAYLKLRYK